MKTKYIRAQYKFVVFPEFLQHRDFARQLFGSNTIIHSAGFVRLFLEDNKIKADCYGHSESLNVSPRRDDNEKILMNVGVEGVNIPPAKYVCSRNSVIVFSEEVSHEAVARAAFGEFSGTAGYIKMKENGDIDCFGEALGVSASPSDIKHIERLFQITESY